jgi:hypothetical protein
MPVTLPTTSTPAYVSVNVALPTRVPPRSWIIAVADVPIIGSEAAGELGDAGGRPGVVGAGFGGVYGGGG